MEWMYAISLLVLIIATEIIKSSKLSWFASYMRIVTILYAGIVTILYAAWFIFMVTLQPSVELVGPRYVYESLVMAIMSAIYIIAMLVIDRRKRRK